MLLIRALEENDSKGDILSFAERQTATREANPPERDGAHARERNDGRLQLDLAEAEFVARRAELLLGSIGSKHPEVRNAYERARWAGAAQVLICGAAFFAGLLSNELGAEKRVNIVAFPLLGMVVWNVAVYVLMAARCIMRPVRGESAVGFSGPLIRETTRFVTGLWRMPRAGQTADRAERTQLLAAGLSRFASDWLREGRDLHLARARFALHLGAVALALGAIAGMYLRGLAFEYVAGWESTFLEAPTVHRLLTVVLGPASWITGIEIPTIAQLESMRWRDGFAGVNAADWIHLYAATAGWVIVAPRFVLAWRERTKLHRYARDFVFSDALGDYFERLFRAGHGGGRIVRVIPYGVEPGAAARERLRTSLFELFGWKSHVDFADSIAYGAEDEFLSQAASEDGGVVWAIVFNMASTPEPENHGRLLQGLKQVAAAGQNQLVVLLEQSSYRRRFADSSVFEKRIDERTRLWKQLAECHGLRLAVVDLERDAAILDFETARESIWNGEEKKE